MLWLLSALGFVRKALQAAFAMAMRYPREVAIMLLLVAAAWLWHGKSAANDRADRIEARAKADNALWAKAHATNLASIKLLTDTLNDQSARVRGLATASERQQRAAQAALGRATARRDASEAVALRIERGAPVKGCVTAREVLAAKGEL